MPNDDETLDPMRVALPYDPTAQRLDIAPANREKVAPISVDAACYTERERVHNHSQGWAGQCQRNARTAYNLPAWATSALIAATMTEHHRAMHTVKRWEDIPRGAFIYFDYQPFGHVMVAGLHHAFSNDYYVRGAISVVPRDIPAWRGRQHIIGWSFWTPFGSVG